MAARHSAASSEQPHKQRIVFTLDAPEAQSVVVTGTFCDWQTNSCHLKKDRKGVWKTALSRPPGRYEYRFLVDGEWRDDPNCTERVANPFGSENCVLHVLREVTQAVRETMERAATP